MRIPISRPRRPRRRSRPRRPGWLRRPGSRRARAAIALGAVVALAAAYVFLWQPPLAVRIAAEMTPRILYRVATDQKLVALTIDDGPSAFTGRILDRLAAHDARATFFLIGARAREHPELLERIRAAGHEVGNHMMKDRPTVLFGTGRFEQELARTERILGLDAHGPGKVFRPPSSWIRGPQLTVLERRGYRCVLGSVYPHDTKHRHAGLSAWYVLRKVRPGGIVILHEGAPSRRAILPILDRVLPELTRRGYRIVPVSELLAAGEAAPGERAAPGDQAAQR